MARSRGSGCLYRASSLSALTDACRLAGAVLSSGGLSLRLDCPTRLLSSAVDPMSAAPTCFMSAPDFAWLRSSYPRSLAHALRDLGVRVAECDDKSAIAPRLARTKGPTVLHMHWLHMYTRGRTPIMPAVWSLRLAARLEAAKRSGAKLVWTAHNLRDHEAIRPGWDAALGDWVASRADAIIAHGEMAKQMVVDRFRVSPAKVRVIPHPGYVGTYPNDADRCTARQSARLGDDLFVFAFVGMIRPYKGLNHLLDAFLSLPGDRFRLRIAGQVLYEKELPALRAKVARDPRVELIPGFVPNEDLQRHMNAADAVVLPYEDVLTSGAALLAMSFGKCCIAPRKGCLIDVFAPEGVFHYASNAGPDLTRALAECAQARESLAERGEANLRRAAGWTWPSAAAATLRLYRDLQDA